MRDALEQGQRRWQWWVGWVVMVSLVQARRLVREEWEAQAVRQEQAGWVARARVSGRGLAQVLPQALEVAVMAAAVVLVQGTAVRAVELGLAVV